MKLRKTILALACVAVTMSLTGCWETSNGEKIGTIVKFAKEGAIFGTWEAELIRGGMNSGSGAFGNIFHFTVEKPELINKVEQALQNQKEVRIKYHKEMFSFLRSENDSYFLDAIEIIN